MKTALLCFALLIFYLVCTRAHGSPPPRRYPARQQATLDWLRARQYVREASRYPGNDGPAVAAIIRAGGGVPGEHPQWCGFTQAADQRAHCLPIPARGLQGGARYWFPATGPDAERLLYRAGRSGSLDSIAPGDLLGMAYAPNPVIHHITRADEVVPPLRKGRPPRGFYCLGGNEGHYPNAGVHRTFYLAIGSLNAAARWDYWRRRAATPTKS